MTAHEQRQTLEDVIRKQALLELELQKLRNATYKSQKAAERANKRITVLEKRMDDINSMLVELTKSSVKHGAEIERQGEKIDNFDKKQDVFLGNQMQLSRWFTIIIISILVILGGLVGIKLVFPTL
ncbi:hypothetical protein LWL40_27515 (plasmid) [Bacillus thuringiensis]|uniref:hypothetical protein n=1 Tax=Bacillus thuringiensis TaxID=1428 RepID=UPI003D74BB17